MRIRWLEASGRRTEKGEGRNEERLGGEEED